MNNEQVIAKLKEVKGIVDGLLSGMTTAPTRDMVAVVAGVIQKMCVNVFGAKAVIPADWNLNNIASALVAGSLAYRVELELAIAQGIAECHFGVNPTASRSRKTRNIFNVGNTDDGGNLFLASWEAGIALYFRLMSREYSWKDDASMPGWVTMAMMVKHDFERPIGDRYATAPSYTQTVKSIYDKVKALTAINT